VARPVPRKPPRSRPAGQAGRATRRAARRSLRAATRARPAGPLRQVRAPQARLAVSRLLRMVRTHSLAARARRPAAKVRRRAARVHKPAVRAHRRAAKGRSLAVRARRPAAKVRRRAVRVHKPAVRAHRRAAKGRSLAVRVRRRAVRARKQAARVRRRVVNPPVTGRPTAPDRAPAQRVVQVVARPGPWRRRAGCRERRERRECPERRAPVCPMEPAVRQAVACRVNRAVVADRRMAPRPEVLAAQARRAARRVCQAAAAPAPAAVR
jgi:hypothetical protein